MVSGPKVLGSIPKKRQELLQWNGWGYKDSGFYLKNLGTEKNPNYTLDFKGTRYEIGTSGIPYFYEWVRMKIGLDPSQMTLPQEEPNYPDPIINDGKCWPLIVIIT